MCGEDHNGVFHNILLKLDDYHRGNYYINISKVYNLHLIYITTIEELMKELKKIDEKVKKTKRKLIISFSGHACSSYLRFSNEKKGKN